MIMKTLLNTTEIPTLEKQIAQLCQKVDQISIYQNQKEAGDALSKPILIEENLTQLSGNLRHLSHQVALLEEDHAKLQALAAIGQAINSTLHQDEVLRSVMDTIIRLTGAERSFLMLKDDHGDFKTQIARNWEQKTLEPQEFAISHTIVNEVITNGEPVLTTNAQVDSRFGKARSVSVYNLRSILCVPLKIKNRLIGVIYADNRVQAGLFTQTEEDLLIAFSNQAAIALDNANLFSELKQSTAELEYAYDSTLIGWARALELRDYETVGHSQRVTSMSVKLAKAMGIENEDLENFRRGAILHDIGKMGIPDQILLKPGKLTPTEWDIMRKHPQYAYEMLSPIKFLQPSLTIPLYHHEKWDGTGYPEKLKGEEIPFEARVFPIVDVWDALTSDRPYRKAWSKTQSLEYIKEESGTQFDPHVVEVFMTVFADLLVDDSSEASESTPSNSKKLIR